MNSTDSTRGWYYLGPDVPAATPPEGGRVSGSWMRRSKILTEELRCEDKQCKNAGDDEL